MNERTDTQSTGFSRRTFLANASVLSVSAAFLLGIPRPAAAQMRKYTFKWIGYEIKDTRSLHEDTNYITAALSVNGEPIGDPKTKFMGNQNNGTFSVDFSWPPVEVQEGGSVTLFYQILNSGYKNPAEMGKALTVWSQQQQQNPNPPAPSTDWKVILKELVGLLVADCDGPIAPPEGRKVVWSSSDLKNIAPGTTFKESVHEYGNDSPTGCGKNSHYIVHLSVTA